MNTVIVTRTPKKVAKQAGPAMWPCSEPPNCWPQLGRWGLPARMDLLMYLAFRAGQFGFEMPACPSRAELQAIWELLHRVVRLSMQIQQETQGPAGGPLPIEPNSLRQVMRNTDRGWRERFESLAMAAQILPMDPQIIQLMALLAQRQLLDLPLPS